MRTVALATLPGSPATVARSVAIPAAVARAKTWIVTN
jgi:hypothetical protein